MNAPINVRPLPLSLSLVCETALLLAGPRAEDLDPTPRLVPEPDGGAFELLGADGAPVLRVTYFRATCALSEPCIPSVPCSSPSLPETLPAPAVSEGPASTPPDPARELVRLVVDIASEEFFNDPDGDGEIDWSHMPELLVYWWSEGSPGHPVTVVDRLTADQIRRDDQLLPFREEPLGVVERDLWGESQGAVLRVGGRVYDVITTRPEGDHGTVTAMRSGAVTVTWGREDEHQWEAEYGPRELAYVPANVADDGDGHGPFWRVSSWRKPTTKRSAKAPAKSKAPARAGKSTSKVPSKTKVPATKNRTRKTGSESATRPERTGPYHLTPEPQADARARLSYQTMVWRGKDGVWHSDVRRAGESELAWREQRRREIKGQIVREYSRAGKCIWDSRDVASIAPTPPVAAPAEETWITFCLPTAAYEGLPSELRTQLSQTSPLSALWVWRLDGDVCRSPATPDGSAYATHVRGLRSLHPLALEGLREQPGLPHVQPLAPPSADPCTADWPLPPPGQGEPVLCLIRARDWSSLSQGRQAQLGEPFAGQPLVWRDRGAWREAGPVRTARARQVEGLAKPCPVFTVPADLDGTGPEQAVEWIHLVFPRQAFEACGRDTRREITKALRDRGITLVERGTELVTVAPVIAQGATHKATLAALEACGRRAQGVSVTEEAFDVAPAVSAEGGAL